MFRVKYKILYLEQDLVQDLVQDTAVPIYTIYTKLLYIYEWKLKALDVWVLNTHAVVCLENQKYAYFSSGFD